MPGVRLANFFFFAKALYILCRRLLRTDIFACVLLSSFSGFMVVGFVDSPFDAPRLTLLFFFVAIHCLDAKTASVGDKLKGTLPVSDGYFSEILYEY